MRTYEIPRDYKGEGRILYIFSTKGLIFYFILKMLGFATVGIIITLIFAAIGFAIGTLKVPEANGLEITKKTGGENIDDVIIRWIKFKKNGNKIYVYKPEEETKDGQ